MTKDNPLEPPTYEELAEGIESIREIVVPLLSVEEGQPINCGVETYWLADKVYRAIVATLNPSGYSDNPFS